MADTHAYQLAEDCFLQFKVMRPDALQTRARCAKKDASDGLEIAVWCGAALAPVAPFADRPRQGLSTLYQPHNTGIVEDEVARAVMRREDSNNTALYLPLVRANAKPEAAVLIKVLRLHPMVAWHSWREVARACCASLKSIKGIKRMSTTNAERLRAYKAKMKEAGFKRLSAYVHPELAAFLARERKPHEYGGRTLERLLLGEEESARRLVSGKYSTHTRTREGGNKPVKRNASKVLENTGDSIEVCW